MEDSYNSNDDEFKKLKIIEKVSEIGKKIKGRRRRRIK